MNELWMGTGRLAHGQVGRRPAHQHPGGCLLAMPDRARQPVRSNIRLAGLGLQPGWAAGLLPCVQKAKQNSEVLVGAAVHESSSRLSLCCPQHVVKKCTLSQTACMTESYILYTAHKRSHASPPLDQQGGLNARLNLADLARGVVSKRQKHAFTVCRHVWRHICRASASARVSTGPTWVCSKSSTQHTQPAVTLPGSAAAAPAAGPGGRPQPQAQAQALHPGRPQGGQEAAQPLPHPPCLRHRQRLRRQDGWALRPHQHPHRRHRKWHHGAAPAGRLGPPRARQPGPARPRPALLHPRSRSQSHSRWCSRCLSRLSRTCLDRQAAPAAPRPWHRWPCCYRRPDPHPPTCHAPHPETSTPPCPCRPPRAAGAWTASATAPDRRAGSETGSEGADVPPGGCAASRRCPAGSAP